MKTMDISALKRICWVGDGCVGLACADLQRDLQAAAEVSVQMEQGCRIGPGILSAGTVEQPEFAALAAPYFDRLPSQWEEYAVRIMEDRILILGTDKRAAMWGIYRVSAMLGVLPGGPMTQCGPVFGGEKSPFAALPLGTVWDRPKTYRFRGWFINDEDMLCAWHSAGIRDCDYRHYRSITDVQALAPVVETALRMGMNLMIPATLLDIDDPRQEKLVAYCQSRGMYVSQHHIEPLGVDHWNYKGYYEKQGQEYPFSYVTNPRQMEACWRHYAKKWARYGKDVIWQLGLRGKGDVPVWFTDDSISSKEQWGTLISEAIGLQYSIVEELVGADFHSTATLWMEGAELHAKGYLALPEKTMVIFSDVGTTQMMSADFYRIPRDPRRDYGLYYHVAYWGDGPHLAVGNDPRKMLYNYGQAIAKGDQTYSILNVANLRETLLSVEQNSMLVWDYDGFSLQDFCIDWCRGYLGNEAASGLLAAYFACFMVGTVEELKGMCSVHFALHPVDTDFGYYTVNDGGVKKIGFRALKGEPKGFWLPRLRESMARFRAFYDRLLPLVTTPYGRFFAFQSRYMLLMETWSYGCVQYMETGGREHLLSARDAMAALLQEREQFAVGAYENWYRGDSKINCPSLLKLVEDRLQ